MANTREVVIVGAARTAIGTYGGSLKDLAPSELGAIAVKEAFARAKVDPAQAGQIVFGHVIHTETRDMYVSRVVGINAGMSKESTALTLNRLCGSGLQAIVSAANAIQLNETDIAVGGGVENMSRAMYSTQAARFGARMGDIKMVDMMVGALSDPFGGGHMGITAENVAEKYSISREEQDAFAVESQKRATAAIAAGHFASQIVPVELKTRKGVVLFDTDEYPKADTTIESLAKLKPAFKKDGGTVTAGNSSGINDGAAACVLMEAGAAERAGLTPLARLVSYAVAGVDPSIMGTGPIPAVQLALKRAGLNLNDMHVIESNEAFAAQSLGVCKGLGLDPAITNVNGGAIALGHPLGASGAIITIKCLYELIRTNKRYGLITMCIGGGQGIAAIIERI
ncbi:acetyl-CoA C-acyltransferase family protein [Glaciimonas sp. CA11.2]|uniref:acetyl-CoA C-acyltransferase family protein n=1 Tax=unclassified Glaciimonas TaxID=2644401 RepID=UPI002AB5D54F|nr:MULTISPECIES: acetyl-CoA C-acyltransferase family protein [unclassified Glaciimonas]MDY7547344.1 acetyl-CoA C-acyltransferase family protein [Glaciimonas sp. CA11.2]MEB0012623.1 acetyl-CoA C-acyltransferase family protein [Glaciimonas sp. Cout2]MEB0083037.1 acetyl-CoA C-acyltransferase family protein [Glaciimonas sp. Gout2]MEB0163221.1 acetyl-CoA C-acyltransferase family protein [Glaciimonas sp. CA11.2]